jgi:hypothetical protein
MSNKSKWVSAAVAVTALSTLATVSLTAAPAEAAVVYCKTAGVPQGCVVRVAPIAPVTVRHVGYTRVTPYGVRHVGYTRVRR